MLIKQCVPHNGERKPELKESHLRPWHRLRLATLPARDNIGVLRSGTIIGRPFHERLRKSGRRAIVSIVAFLLLLAAVMFVPAGLGWWRGWLFLAVFTLQIVLMAPLYLAKNPEPFVARSKMQKGTKGWDRVLFYLLQALILAIFPVAGLDHCSAAPYVSRVRYRLLPGVW